MKKTILFVLALSLCSGARAGELIGKAGITKRENKTHTWLHYSVRSPNVDLTNVWIKLEASIRDVDSAQPEPLECGLKINMRLYPAYEYAQYLDGALHLYFDRLESKTLLEFAIGYEKPTVAPNFFQDAALSLKSNEWTTSTRWVADDYYLLSMDSPMRIVIDGAGSCYLY